MGVTVTAFNTFIVTHFYCSSHIGATIKTRTLEYRENLVTITDYSPGWAYSDVSTICISRPRQGR